MLKIKDNVDLKELEKFGFTYLDYNNTYIKDLGNDRRGAFCTLYIEDRILHIDFCGDDNGYSGNDILDDVIYDLIKEGLVEKVDKEV